MKFKNYGLWVALGSLAVMVLNDLFGISETLSMPYVEIILTILVAAGVISNPSQGKGFKDNA